jgi:integrative and conjugative element protein (TIGR02256 family)
MNVRHAVAMNSPIDGPDLRIHRHSLSDIEWEAARFRDGLETGGILLGTDDSQTITIRHAGGPGPKAFRETNRFLRDLAHAQKLAALAWATDRSQWIGEWHTHPSGNLRPSQYDLDAYSKHLHDPELGFNRFVSILVGHSPSGEVLMVPWVIDRKSARPVPATISGAAANAARSVSINSEEHIG